VTSCATVRACATPSQQDNPSNPSQADGGERKQPVAALLARCPSPFVPSAHHIYYILTVHWNGGATAPVQLLIHHGARMASHFGFDSLDSCNMCEEQMGTPEDDENPPSHHCASSIITQIHRTTPKYHLLLSSLHRSCNESSRVRGSPNSSASASSTELCLPQ
jgi:hypothetical protein